MREREREEKITVCHCFDDVFCDRSRSGASRNEDERFPMSLCCPSLDGLKLFDISLSLLLFPLVFSNQVCSEMLAYNSRKAGGFQRNVQWKHFFFTALVCS